MTKDGNNDHHTGVLIEDVYDKLQGIAEAVSGLADKVDTMDKRLVRVEENTDLIPPLTEAVRAQSLDFDNHEQRLKQLEQLAA